MTRSAIIFAFLFLAAPLSAQERKPAQPPPPKGVGGKTMEMCKIDAQKLCSGKALQQECLVRNWTRISSDCQDALSTPMRESGGG